MQKHKTGTNSNTIVLVPSITSFDLSKKLEKMGKCFQNALIIGKNSAIWMFSIQMAKVH